MDVKRLSTGEKLLGGSALVLLLLSFLDLWAKLEVSASGQGASQRFNAWDGYGFMVALALILALVALALVLMRAASVSVSLPWSMVYLGVAGLALLLMLLALIAGPDESGSGSAFGVSIEISRSIGIFLGTLLTAAMLAGAWMHHSESPDALPNTTTTPPAPEGPPPV